MKAVKFGGTSVANADLLLAARDIMQQDSDRYIAVISACGKDNEIPYGSTNLALVLVGEYTKQTRGLTPEEALGLLKKRYRGICQRFGYKDLEDEIVADIETLPKRDREYVASMPDKYTARIFARVSDLEYIDPENYIVIADEKTRQPDLEESVRRLSSLKGRRFVMAGFSGNYNGRRVMTFNRGGSELTLGLVANATDATLAEIFTDVDGIYYADPTILRNPSKIVPGLTFREVRELSAMSSKISEDAIYPMMIKDIPIHVRNSFNLNHPGTLITAENKRTNGIPIAGVAGNLGTAFMSLYKYRMDEEIGFAQKVLTIFECMDINVKSMPALRDYQGISFEKPKKF